MRTLATIAVTALTLLPRAAAQESAAADLLARLGANAFTVQRDAALEAAASGDPQVAARLIELVRSDAHPTVRAFAAESLGRCGDPRAADVLVAAARDGALVFVRQRALLGLAATGDRRAFGVLVTALDDPNVRNAAALGLGELADPRAAPILAARLRAHGAQAASFDATATALLALDRATAVQAMLEEFGRDGAVPPDALVEQLRGCADFPEVRARATVLASSDDAVIGGAALQVLGAVGDLKTVSFLLGRVHDVDATMRAETVAALGEIGHEFAVDPIAKWAMDDDPAVRLAVAVALARIAHPTAVRPLSDILDRTAEPLVAIRALEGLGRIGDRAALAAIARRLEDESRTDQPLEMSRVLPYPYNVAVCDAAWWAAQTILDGAPPCALEQLSVVGATAPSRTVDERAVLRRRLGG